MNHDPEFDDFLNRRRPLFRRDVDDGLEPPPELDRIVLRQARDAIESERPMRLFNMPRWAAPMAIAATLVVGLSIVFRSGMQPERRAPEVRVESISHTQIAPPAPPPAPPVAIDHSGPVVVTLAEPRVAQPAPMAADNRAPAGGAAPAWRDDARAWQAEIERLRTSGETARAEAEQAEFNRRYRTYAVSPDR